MKSKKQTAEYWRKRFDSVESESNMTARKYNNKIKRLYAEANREIDSKLQYWLQRFADNNEIDIESAKKLIKGDELAEFKWSLEQYAANVQKEYISPELSKLIENSSARWHIRRYEAMKIDVSIKIETMMNASQETMLEVFRQTYKDSYYKSLFELSKGTEVGFDFGRVNKKQLEQLINKPWSASGKDFSSSVWQNRTKLVKTLNQEIDRLVLGKGNVEHAVKNISKTMDSSRYAAERLVYTEVNRMNNEAVSTAFEECGATQYEIVTVSDEKTCELCKAMGGQVFDLIDRVEGSTVPPFHPNCRCTIRPIVPEYIEGSKPKGEINYSEWKKLNGIDD